MSMPSRRNEITVAVKLLQSGSNVWPLTSGVSDCEMLFDIICLFLVLKSNFEVFFLILVNFLKCILKADLLLRTS